MTTALAYTSATNTLRWFGEIGQDVLAEDAAAALQSAGGAPVNISIFSFGGCASTGMAIYSLLSQYSGRVTITIDGVAASAASLICMAADRLLMASNALIMIHDPWAVSAGNADTMRTSADLLDKYGQSYRSSYAHKSGASIAQVTEWMAAGSGAGTWFTAEEALAAGLADEITGPAQIHASAPRLPAGRFTNPPAILAQWATPSTPEHPMTAAPQANTTEALNVEAAADGELSKAEANRQLSITRAAATAGLSAAETQSIIDTTKSTQEGLMAVVSAHASVVEGRAGAAGHPARQYASPNNNQPAGVEGMIHAALRGEKVNEPIWLALRAAGLGHGNDAQSVWRSALAGDTRWTARASMSTSDLPNLLQSAGNRRLMERFQVADAGIRLAASVRRLVDFRAASVLDAGMVGTAKVIKEGGQINFGAVDEAAASYKPSRYGLGLSFSVEALANDDLSALDESIAQLADAMIDAENVALVDLLEGAANGRNAPDGTALFAAAHGNTVTAGPVTIATVGTAVQKLREQKALGGRYIAQAPVAILCGTAIETTVRQLLSTAVNAAQASNVNPWANLEIAVEPRLSGSYVYILGSGRKALELGRLTEGPELTTERQFETSAFRAKSEHVFGSIVASHSSIVRIPTT
jgi:ATP-dependent protease ClpP protease subunit